MEEETNQATRPRRRRRTQLELLLQRGPEELPEFESDTEDEAQDQEEQNKNCECHPDPAYQHKRCWRKLGTKEAVRPARYSAARAANAMAHLKHNQLYIHCPGLQKVQQKPTLPYHGWCRYPYLHGSVAAAVKRLHKTTTINTGYHIACKGECKTDYSQLIHDCLHDENAARVILENHGILPKYGDVKCPNEACKGNLMVLNKRGNQFIWRCNKRIKILRNKKPAKWEQCTKRISSNNTNFFSKIQLPLNKILMFMQEFVEKDFKIERSARICHISTASALKLKRLLERVCVDICDNQNPIGGPGSTVEIDETICVRRKKAGSNTKGRPVAKELWLFGGVERYGTGSFLHPLILDELQEDGTEDVVPDSRTADSLIPKIESYIRSGSLIMSDGWTSYSKLSGYPEDKSPMHQYKHYVVKHDKEFVREDDPFIHINTVERHWEDVKEYCKRPGMRRMHIKKYIGRYLLINPCRRRCTTPTERFRRRKYIAETALHRLLIACANHYQKTIHQA